MEAHKEFHTKVRAFYLLLGGGGGKMSTINYLLMEQLK